MKGIIAFFLFLGALAHAKTVIKVSGRTYFSPSLEYFVQLRVNGSYGQLHILDRDENEISVTKQFNINGAFDGLSLVWNEDESKFFASFHVGRSAYKKLIIQSQTGKILNCDEPQSYYHCYSDTEPRYSHFISKNVLSSVHKPLHSYDYDRLTMIDTSSAAPKYEVIELQSMVEDLNYVDGDLFLLRSDSFRPTNPSERVFLVNKKTGEELCNIDLDNGHTYVKLSPKKNLFALVSPYSFEVSFYNLECKKLFSKVINGKKYLKSAFSPDGNLHLFENGRSQVFTINTVNQSVHTEDLVEDIYGLKWNIDGKRLVLFGKKNVVNALLLKASSFTNGTITNTSEYNGSVDLSRKGLITWGPLGSDSFYLFRNFDVGKDEVHVYSW